MRGSGSKALAEPLSAAQLIAELQASVSEAGLSVCTTELWGLLIPQHN